MNYALLQRIFDQRFKKENDKTFFDGKELPERNGIYRFTPDISYSSGNFSMLREQHAKLQLDSENGTKDRLKSILERTQWPPEFFKDKLILECGCGAGPDTEVLLKLGAQVVSVDIAGVDACKSNIGENPNHLIFQASIDDLPFKNKSFDIVWCHRVLQHTPSPEKTLDHILSFVKEDGAVFVHSYGRSFSQMFSWKYALRPITARLDPEFLYRMVKAWVPPLYWFTNVLRRIPPDFLGRNLFKIAYHLVPIRNYRFVPEFANKDDAFILEYAVHDTFDCLSPRYDSPLGARSFHEIAKKHLHNEFEVVGVDTTFLRTKLKGARQ